VFAIELKCRNKKGYYGKVQKKVNKKSKEQSKMNKQPTTIRTYLLRGAFLLSLAFVIALPFALGQRQGNKGSLAQPGGDCPTPWALVASMPLDLYGAAGASDGTYSYHAGGYSFTTFNNLNSLYRYDPVANSWTTLAPMPTAAIMPSAVYYPTTNKIYVFGGEDANTGTNFNITRIYNIATNTWTTGANMPDVRSFMASGYNSANGKIYLVSGYNTGTVDSAQPDTWEYDPVANTFTSKADFPHPAGGMASGVINGHLYVAGGRDAANLNINLNWDYDIAANTWTQRADMPGAQPNVPGSAVALDALFAFGGGNPFTGPASPTAAARPGFRSTKAAFATERVRGPTVPDTANNTFVYDPATDVWTTSANMNTVRSFTSGAYIGNSNKIIAAGGFDGGFTLASAETLDACIPGPTPTPTPPPPSLWYNGDYDGDATGNGLSNEENTFAAGFSHVFDDFIVTDSGGWDITSVFSNNQMTTNATSATFEIRQGMSAGNGGTLVASGSTDTPVITPTGRFGFGLPEFTVEVTGLSVHLDPGTYWLNVTPVDNLDGGRSFNSTTLGANCVGTPCGNDQMAFFDSTLFGFVFEPTLNLCSQCGDFSMGVRGSVSGGTPTPTPTPGQIRLKANTRVGQDRVLVHLKWTGATTPKVSIYRNGARIATVQDANTYTDVLTEPGTFTYQVCEARTRNCSNEVRVMGP
jgi:N-acetylneuraminic acid mutarotase